jgi:hypothetical protein
MTLLFLASLALAQDLDVVVDGDVVRGTAHVDVTAVRFLTELKDPGWIGRMSGTGTTAEVLGKDGDCLRVAYVSPNLILTARYTVKRCMTSDGVRISLIESNTFSAYETTWRVVPEGEGARITYEVDLTSSLRWVPNSLVRSETRRSIHKTLKQLVKWAAAAG